MKKLTLFVVIGLVLMPLSIRAQERKTGHRLGFEVGYQGLFGSTVVPERVRSVKSVHISEIDYLSEFYMGTCEYDTGHRLDMAYAGLKYEAVFLKNRLGVSTGIRFYQFSSTLNHHRDYDFFIWMLNQEETASDYVTIRSINQKSHSVGLPLEIRFFPAKSDRFFKQYIKIGGAMNYRMTTKNAIDFYKPEMSKYDGQVSGKIVNPCTFSGFVFPAIGFRWGKNNQPWFNAEFQFPGFIIAERPHAFVHPDVGVGFQFSVLFPLNKTK